MLTSRGWWLFTIALTVLGLGAVVVLRPGPPRLTLLVLGLTLVLWFAAEWLYFFAVVRLAVRSLRIDRELRDERGPVTTFWAGRAFEVRLRARLDSRLPLHYAHFADYTPAGTTLVGDPTHGGPLRRGSVAEWGYRVRCPLPGAVRFEGVRVRLADLQGFFAFDTFLRAPVRVAVLPTLVDAEAHRRATKRFNLLPPPGVHRHRRPGNGSELLELRDYRPGDPPKRIAWKASAKRDRIITREYESEVPIRCTLLLDTSPGLRLGPPGHTALAGLASVCAAVAQAAIANRDLIGLALCDADDTRYVAPARTPAHLIDLLHRLAGTAELAPRADAAPLDDLLSRAYRFAVEVYPDLLRPAINRFPFWLPWLAPKPAYTDRHRTGRSGPISTELIVAFLAALAAGAVQMLGAEIAESIVVLIVAAIIAPLSIAGGRGVWRVLSGRRHYLWRKKLSALLAVQYRLGSGALATLLEDDDACGRCLQRFLGDHRVPFDVPLYLHGRFQHADAGKVAVLAAALVRAVSRGHDNELFVILADLLELDADLGPLLRAVQVARARHHQVLVVQTWPAGLPPPNRWPEPETAPAATWPADALVMYATQARVRRAWLAVRRAFGRLGVPILSAAHDDPARLIIHRIDQMRSVQGVGRS